ncbi:MAG: restriction endonuclease, partial [Prevotellaceae bacterium]|nr:restriction endonuclease [Prevotellaceae bacterium]
SKFLNWYYQNIINPEKGEALAQVKKGHISQLPIPAVSPAVQRPIIDLADEILRLKSANPQADTAALERQIDRLVYELYGLTEEEIKIVEEK